VFEFRDAWLGDIYGAPIDAVPEFAAFAVAHPAARCGRVRLHDYGSEVAHAQ
jgi:hypothetical protein